MKTSWNLDGEILSQVCPLIRRWVALRIKFQPFQPLIGEGGSQDVYSINYNEVQYNNN